MYRARTAKSSILHEMENRWGGFLFDENVQSEVVRKYFIPGQASARGKDDSMIVTDAREDARTIVTTNQGHLIHYIREAQKTSNRPLCNDCWGLVVLIPDKDFQRQHALEKADIRRGIRLDGQVIPWKAIAYANLCVKVEKNGKIQVLKFKRCPFCQRDFPITAPWYLNLREI